ncbi:DUF1036 domain-containing protein [Anabaena sp. UHCC 0253]|nr:DUF1036 domain-containing protein [Anabaena sp. UHCC 0204]MTJ55498.1 DUF1036 domain-containing protein [Anabaena sp. UHCC 0253]
MCPEFIEKAIRRLGEILFVFQFTNETNGKIYLAFGYWDRIEDDWISEGWWTIQPGCTITPYAKQLLNRYYYYYAYYARNSGYSGKWSGSVPFYVKTAAFEIKELGKLMLATVKLIFSH